MKRLLLPLLAALALPTAVNAESYWLVLSSAGKDRPLIRIKMKSMEHCEEQRKKVKGGYQVYCFIGK